jgi:O-antigen ligase
MIAWIFIIFVCFLPILEPILPSTSFGPNIPDIGIGRVLQLLLIMVYLFEVVFIRKIHFFNKWILIVILYSAVIIASISWSNYSYNGTMIRFLFDKVLMPLITAIIGLKVFRTTKNIELYMKSMCISAFIISAITILEMTSGSIYQFLFGGAVTEIARAEGVYSNPNTLAIFLVLTIPCIVFCIEMKLLPKFLSWLIALSIVGGIISTISRKGIVTGGFAFIIFFFLKKQYIKVISIALLITLLIVAFTSVTEISSRFAQKKFGSDIESKWDLAYAGLRMFSTSPIIGLGYNGYRENYKKYFPRSSKEQRPVHNIFVRVLAEAGLLGFLPFISMFLYPLFISIVFLVKERGKQINKITLNLSIFCIATILPFAINGWFAGGLLYGNHHITVLYTHIVIFFCGIRNGLQIENRKNDLIFHDKTSYESSK